MTARPSLRLTPGQCSAAKMVKEAYGVGGNTVFAKPGDGSRTFLYLLLDADGLHSDFNPSKYFYNPLSPEEALENIENLLRQPRVRVLSEDDGFLAIYRQVSSNFPVRGNLVADAHLAALLLQHGVRRIYTADSDFKKFEFLEAFNPFS